MKEHGKLTYPEGTACAEVQVAAQAGGELGRVLVNGGLIGAFYTVLEKFVHLFPGEPDFPIRAPGFRTSVGGSLTAELLGVGFIIGPQVAAVMLAGGAVGWLVIIPMIYLFGGASGTPIPPETTMAINDMGSFDIWNRYLRYIGAGAVAFGGLFTLVKSTPTLLASFKMALAALKEKSSEEVRRTDREIPLQLVLGMLALIGLLVSFLPLMSGSRGTLGLLAGAAVVVFSFFFVTVSSRIVGLLGASSNPISGMTIATVLLCTLIFGGLYDDLNTAKVAVLTIGGLVCIAAAISGDTSQDLKTGFLLGSTPRHQQVGELIGVAVSAVAMTAVLTLFAEDITSGNFKAPQANLIKLVIDGVLEGSLPWGLVLIGIFLAFCVEIMGLPTLAFAVGLYLPVHLAVPIMVGGLIRLAVEKLAKPESLNEQRERGVLFSSGLIAGAALIGVTGAALKFFEITWFDGTVPEGREVMAVVAFLALSAILSWVCRPKKEN